MNLLKVPFSWIKPKLFARTFGLSLLLAGKFSEGSFFVVVNLVKIV